MGKVFNSDKYICLHSYEPNRLRHSTEPPQMSMLFVCGLAALVWSIRSGQMDDLDTPALRMLNDDAAPKPSSPAVAAKVASDSTTTQSAKPL
jgi:cbb3-type cytochrome oxidase maturation protein